MSEIVWRDSQGNGLTQEEVDDLAYVATNNEELAERERENKRVHFVDWLRQHGKLPSGGDDLPPAA